MRSFTLACLASTVAASLPGNLPSIPMKGVEGRMRMPLVGIGTWEYDSATTEKVVSMAFKMGYRHVDTALVYQNHKGVATALSNTGLAREDYFVTTKIPGGLNASATAAALDQCLEELQMGYVDLMLMHFPDSFEGKGSPEIRKEQWLAMERWAKSGKAKALGVSHFCRSQLDDVLSVATVPVALNQVEYHVGMGSAGPDATDYKEYCQRKGVVYMSFSTLCGPCPAPGNSTLKDGPLVTEIGKAHNKSGAQISLKWAVQQGIPVVPKSQVAAHLEQNLQLFDFKLSRREMHRLTAAKEPAVAGGGDGKTSGDCKVPVEELIVYCLDPEYYNELVAARAEKNEEERELWIKLLINKLEEEVQQSLELGQPKDPAAFLRREVFLPGARPEVVEAVRQGLAESEGEEAGGDGISRKWSRRWSAVAQRRASHRAEPMALPMLQRSWAKVHAAMDARAPGRIQLLRDLMRRGLDLDFVSLGAEQPSVLWLAAANDDVEVLRFCLACGADPHREASGLLPLETAASTGAVAAASLLLRSGAVVSRSLHFAAASGQLDVLRTLLDAAADPALRVRGLTAAAVASALGHAEVLEVLAVQPQSLAAQLSSNAFTVLDLAEAAGHGPLQLAAQASHERCCASLLRLGGQASAPAAVAQGAPEDVRAVLEPHRMALFTSLSRPDETAKAFSAALDGLDASQREAAMAGAGPLRPAALAALLDDQTAMGLLTKAAPSAPSALMWAQWAGAQAAQGELLSAGVTLSNADLESLRRLGRVRRVAEEAGGVAGRLLASAGWQNLKQAAANLPQEDGLSSRLAGLRERMAWEGAQGTTPAAGGEEAETATDPLEAPAGVLADLLGQERFALVRFLVQREIASGSSWSTLAPAQLLMLHAASRYTDVHARCSDYLPLLQSSLQALPVSRGPCYRAVTAERARPLLEGCKPGSVVQWAPGTTGTLDFGAALAAIGVGGTTKGVIFKVRRLLTGREALPQGSQVFFLGGPLRVAGLFALRGPLLSAERQSAAAASPTADRLERLGPWSAQLDMVRRPRALEFSEALKEPLVMVLLDEEEAS